MCGAITKMCVLAGGASVAVSTGQEEMYKCANVQVGLLNCHNQVVAAAFVLQFVTEVIFGARDDGS